MEISKGVSRLEKFSNTLSVWFERIAIVAIVGMMLATLVDVVGSKLIHWPLPASTEIVYLLQVIAIAGALAITKIDGRHIRIEFVDKVPQPGRAILHSLVALFGLGLFIILCWQSYQYAQSLRINTEVTSNAKIVFYPFALWLGLCCIPVVLILLKEFITSLVELIKR